MYIALICQGCATNRYTATNCYMSWSQYFLFISNTAIHKGIIGWVGLCFHWDFLKSFENAVKGCRGFKVGEILLLSRYVMNYVNCLWIILIPSMHF